MKKTTWLLSLPLLIAACADNRHTPQNASAPDRPSRTMARLLDEDSPFIPKDSANKMLDSYLNSIQAADNDTDVRSVIIDADALRTYLAADSSSIRKVKVMMAHSLRYINSGHKDSYCGYSNNGLTFILAGYNSAGNYVLLPNGLVLNHGMICPSSCPTAGTARYDRFPAD